MKKTGSLDKQMRKNSILMSLPWMIGFITFFAVPLIYTVIYSFNKMGIGESGGTAFQFVGFQNYKDVFAKMTTKDNQLIVKILATENIRIFTNTPVLMVFSLFAAILINRKFKGRTVARLIFFLPIILGLDIVQSLISSTAEGNFVDAAVDPMFSGEEGIFTFLLQNMFLPDSVVKFLTSLNENIYSIVSTCGVQILLFLAGLQSISDSHYEVAKIEGASAYEIFWKITLPMLSNIMVFVLVYSFVDLFLKSAIADEIYYFAFTQNNIGVGSALSIIYMINVLIDMGVLMLVFKKVVSVTNGKS